MYWTDIDESFKGGENTSQKNKTKDNSKHVLNSMSCRTYSDPLINPKEAEEYVAF